MCCALEVHLLAAPYVPACANISTLLASFSSWSNSYIHHTVLTSFLSTWYELWRNPWFLSASFGFHNWIIMNKSFLLWNRQHGNLILKPTSMAFISPDWSTTAMSYNLQGWSGGLFHRIDSLPVGGADPQVGRSAFYRNDTMGPLCSAWVFFLGGSFW